MLGADARPPAEQLPGPASEPALVTAAPGGIVVHLCPTCCRDHEAAEVAELLGIAGILRRLQGIEQAITNNQEILVSTFADLTATVTALGDTVARVAADLQRLIAGGNLTPDQQAALDKAVSDLTGEQTTLNTADPAPAPPAPTA